MCRVTCDSLGIEQLLAEATRLHKAGDYAAARACYRDILRRDAGHAEALHLLGALLYQTGGAQQAGAATASVRAAVQARPASAKYRHTLGRLLAAQERWPEAADAYRAACDKAPANVQYRMDLARAYKHMDRPALAADAYRQATRLAPAHPGAHLKLAGALRHAGRLAAAADAYRAHLALAPGHAQAAFWLAALRGRAGGGGEGAACGSGAVDVAVGMPADMVAVLFDGYADHFDDHLVGKLGYQTPERLMALLMRAAGGGGGGDVASRGDQRAGGAKCAQPGPAAPGPSWRRCLDLGCGTGLMGPLLRPRVEGALAGVDLSSGMVARARQRGCYDRVWVGELLAALQQRRELGAGGCAACARPAAGDGCSCSCSARPGGGEAKQGAVAGPWDLLVAADVFVYVGDLAPVLQAAATAAAPGAVFAFSTEALDAVSPAVSAPSALEAAAFHLRPTGRYAHSTQHVCAAAAGAGWRVLAQETSVIRFNAGQPIHGHLFVLRLGL